jgi:hypothetical protein
MTTRLRLRNWDKWQTYRKDRGAPPWIKVHRGLMGNPDWAVLTDAEKGQLVSLWIIGAEKGGVIPADPRILRKVCMLDDEPNINKFIELGFVENHEPQDDAAVASTGCQDDAKVTTTRPQDDAPEAETEAEAETDISRTIPPRAAKGYTEDFEDAWADYPKREGGNPKKSAFKAWNARLKTGATVEELHLGVIRYANFIRAKGKEHTSYVKQASTFFGPDEHYTESWEVTPNETSPPPSRCSRGQQSPAAARNEMHRNLYRRLAAEAAAEEGMDTGNLREVEIAL